MNTHPDEPWVHRFTDVVRGHDQVRGLICGHLHRAVTVAWEGRTIAICSSTAPQVSLDLRPIDENNPDDRPMIVAEDQIGRAHVCTPLTNAPLVFRLSTEKKKLTPT